MVAQYITIKTTYTRKNLTKSVVIGELTKFVRRRSNCILGNTKLNWTRYISTTCISVVLNKRLTTKSRKVKYDFNLILYLKV